SDSSVLDHVTPDGLGAEEAREPRPSDTIGESHLASTLRRPNRSQNMNETAGGLGPHDHHHHATPGGDHASAESPVTHKGSAPSSHDQAGAHDRHAGHSVAMFRDKFWITLLL